MKGKSRIENYGLFLICIILAVFLVSASSASVFGSSSENVSENSVGENLSPENYLQSLDEGFDEGSEIDNLLENFSSVEDLKSWVGNEDDNLKLKEFYEDNLVAIDNEGVVDRSSDLSSSSSQYLRAFVNNYTSYDFDKILVWVDGDYWGYMHAPSGTRVVSVWKEVSAGDHTVEVDCLSWSRIPGGVEWIIKFLLRMGYPQKYWGERWGWSKSKTLHVGNRRDFEFTFGEPSPRIDISSAGSGITPDGFHISKPVDISVEVPDGEEVDNVVFQYRYKLGKSAEWMRKPSGKVDLTMVDWDPEEDPIDEESEDYTESEGVMNIDKGKLFDTHYTKADINGFTEDGRVVIDYKSKWNSSVLGGNTSTTVTFKVSGPEGFEPEKVRISSTYSLSKGHDLPKTKSIDEDGTFQFKFEQSNYKVKEGDITFQFYNPTDTWREHIDESSPWEWKFRPPDSGYYQVRAVEEGGSDKSSSDSETFKFVDEESWYPNFHLSKGEGHFPCSFYFDGDNFIHNNHENYNPDSKPPSYSYLAAVEGEEYFAIDYWLYYDDSNGFYPRDQHEDDWEGGTLIFDKDDLRRPNQIIYRHHGNKTSEEFSDIETYQNHPKLYVSCGSHATYDTSDEANGGVLGWGDDWESGGSILSGFKGRLLFDWSSPHDEPVEDVERPKDFYQTYCDLGHAVIGGEAQPEPAEGYWPKHYSQEGEHPGAADPAPWHKNGGDLKGMIESGMDTYLLKVHSSADLHVYDSQGRHVGLDYGTGRVENEIPGSDYVEYENLQMIRVRNPGEGNYRVKVVGKEEGSYDLVLNSTRSLRTTVSWSKRDVSFEDNEVHTYKLNPASPVPTLPENGSFVKDSDPLLRWKGIETLRDSTYEIQIDNDSDFSSPEIRVSEIRENIYRLKENLSNGTYFWRVRLVFENERESWSVPQSFTVDTTPPKIRDLILQPNPFSPDGNGIAENTQISFTLRDELSKLENYQVRIVDSENEIVKTFSENGLDYGEENFNLVWNGRNEDGAVVSDGYYEVSVTAFDEAGNENCETEEVVMDAEKFRIESSDFGEKHFQPSEKNAELFYVLSEDAENWGAVIYNACGEEVRHLVESEPRSVGVNSEVWDGRDDNGNFVSPGLYWCRLVGASFAGEGGTGFASVVSLPDSADGSKNKHGNKHRMGRGRKFEVCGFDSVGFKPFRFNPNLGESTSLEYGLKGGRQVGAVIYKLNDWLKEKSWKRFRSKGFGESKLHDVVRGLRGNLVGRSVRHLIVNDFRSGEISEVWKGLDDDGEVVSPGLYVCELTTVSSTGVGGGRFAFVKVDEDMPVVANVSDSPDPFSPNGDGENDNTEISYTLRSPDSEELRVRIKIRNESGGLVKRFWLRQEPGEHSVVWDGEKTFGGTVENGTYDYEIRAYDGWFEKSNAKIGEIKVKGVSEEEDSSRWWRHG